MIRFADNVIPLSLKTWWHSGTFRLCFRGSWAFCVQLLGRGLKQDLKTKNKIMALWMSGLHTTYNYVQIDRKLSITALGGFIIVPQHPHTLLPSQQQEEQPSKAGTALVWHVFQVYSRAATSLMTSTCVEQPRDLISLGSKYNTNVYSSEGSNVFI